MQPTQQLVKRDPSEVEYVPLGGSSNVKVSVRIVQNLIAVRTKTGRTCSDRDALKFVALCQARKLNPFEGDCFLVGYDGKDGPVFSMITAHFAFLKRAEANPQYAGMSSGVILLQEDGTTVDREGSFVLPNENVVGAWAIVDRKDRPRPTIKRVAMDALKPEYASSFWSKTKAPAQLIKCAESQALRAAFPTLLGALYSQEEMQGEITKEAASMTLPEVIAQPADLPNNEIAEFSGTEPQPVAVSTELKSQPVLDTKQNANANKELSDLVLGAGFNFDQFLAWVRKENWPDLKANDLQSFDDVPPAIAKRLIRAKMGLLAGLESAKKGEL